MSKKRPGEAADQLPVSLVLIVVGAHLRAEISDRPLGYRLRDALAASDVEPIVCSDLWYVNQPDLMERPAIAVGGPGVNAATAHFMNRLPVAFMIEGTLEVRMDLESRPPAAAMWGLTDQATERAVEVFVERYVDGFVRAVATRP